MILEWYRSIGRVVTMRRKKSRAISEQLREAIDASGMSRYRICKEIGLSESTMSHFMAGECGLALTTVDRLGDFLGLTIVAETKPPTKEGR
jgi:hypothetical protein